MSLEPNVLTKDHIINKTKNKDTVLGNLNAFVLISTRVKNKKLKPAKIELKICVSPT